MSNDGGTRRERFPSGDAGLDTVLHGGLLTVAINVIAGLPGSGKTILAQQYVYESAAPDRRALYLSTTSEPFDKIIRFGQSLDFFDASAVGRYVFYEDIGAMLNDGGLPSALERIVELVKLHRPAIMVIDSFKALRTFAADELSYRKFLHRLAGMLSAFPVCNLWVGEYTDEELTTAPEFAVADAIVHMSSSHAACRQVRTLEVIKLRGSNFLSGRHTYRLSGAGIRVFPRLADVGSSEPYGDEHDESARGGTALETILPMGLWPGSSTLVAGPSGSGKTALCLHYLVDGAQRGDPGLLASLQENPTQVRRGAKGFGWQVDCPNIEIMYCSPVDLYIDEWFSRLQERIDGGRIRRVLIDSLGYLAFAVDDAVRFREYIYSLVQRCAMKGVTLVMTFEVSELTHIQQLTDHNISHLADNVILLEYDWNGDEVHRSLTLLKARSSAHQPSRTTFEITDQGVTLGTRQG